MPNRPEPIKPEHDTSSAKRFRDAIENTVLTPEVLERLQVDIFDLVARNEAQIPLVNQPEKRPSKPLS